MKITSVSGVFPVYKPRGITSASFLDELKRRLLDGNNIKKCMKTNFSFTVDLYPKRLGD